MKEILRRIWFPATLFVVFVCAVLYGEDFESGRMVPL